MPKLTIKPSIEEVRELSARGNLIPIYAELPSDLDTPVSLFLRLAGSDPAFLLESVDGGERIARYSFMGVRMREALVLRGRELIRHTLGEKGLKMEPVPIPAPDTDEVEVAIDEVVPGWEPWRPEPAPGHAALRGGHRWRLTLAPGERRSLRVAYAIKIASKHELVGGNRRES